VDGFIPPREPNPGIVGLFLKFGRVNPGFCDSDCLGRVGGFLLAGEFPNPREGPAMCKQFLKEACIRT